MPPELQIYLLGTFRLLVKGAFVPNAAWQKRKAKMLVQLLALRRTHEARREELIEKLFPETDEQTANARFYRVLYVARLAFEPNRTSYSSSNFLINDGQNIKLTSKNGIWIDADEFQQKAQAGLKTNEQNWLESAAALYAGDLLADEPFEDWIAHPREQTKTLFHKVLHRLAENAEKQTDFENAQLWLDRVLQSEPADETAHRAKMRLYCSQGERFRALRQYEKCVAALRHELGVEPDEETKRLRQKIIENERR